MSRVWPPASSSDVNALGAHFTLAANLQPYRMSTTFAICLVSASLLGLSGCASVQVHLGMKVYLDKTPVTTIKASLPKGPAIGPGQKLPLVATVTEPNGKILQTEGAGQGKVMWKDLKVTATIATVNQKGIISRPKDPRISDGKIPHVTIMVPSHPDLYADLDIPVRYDETYTANFPGSSGSSGMNGMDGTDGSSGSSGSMDPNNPSAGGDGGNGTDGSNGGDGGNGGDAPPVQVRIAFRSGTHPLLQVSVSAAGVSKAGHDKFYLVDPQGGSLTVKPTAAPEDQAAEADVEAEVVPGAWDRPAEIAGGTAPMDATAQTARPAKAAALR